MLACFVAALTAMLLIVAGCNIGVASIEDMTTAALSPALAIVVSATFSFTIGGVIAMGPEEEVGSVHARRIVARVKNE